MTLNSEYYFLSVCQKYNIAGNCNPDLATTGIDLALSYEIYKSAGRLFHCSPSAAAGHCM